MTSPRVFISYSHSVHQDKVIAIADQLRKNGVDVVIDEYDVDLGDDLNKFMELTVNDTAMSKVLIMCDQAYVKNANARTGGVGKEAFIISEAVYTQKAPGKFIPVILERDTNGNACCPTFLNGLCYIDLSNEQVYAKNFDILLGTLLGKPRRQKPPLGRPPEQFLDGNISDSPSGVEDTFLNNAEIILAILRKKPNSTKEDLAKETGISQRIIEISLIKLMKKGKLYHLCDNKGTRWKVVD